MNDNNKVSDGNKIDLVVISHILWERKTLFYKACGVAFLIGVVVAFSIPKRFMTEVVLAPEISSNESLSGNVSSLASMVGVKLGSGASDDAIYPEIYPDIISSTPFLTGLFNVKVSSLDGKINTTLYKYIKFNQKEAWWEASKNWVIKLFTPRKKSGPSDNDVVNAFNLTKEQDGTAKMISNMVSCKVDKKTDIITITVTAQDAYISACLADSVQMKLQQYVTNYRTKKARNDLAYMEKLFRESQEQYARARQLYASYSDANQDLVLESFKAKQGDLENEMQLQYNIYTQVAQQLQMAKAKVQERTPAFTQIQPATVPLRQYEPKKMVIVLGFILLAIVLTIVYVIARKPKKTESEE
jgi:uncharacterized protein involved in exopolysaccharide biosynthesis